MEEDWPTQFVYIATYMICANSNLILGIMGPAPSFEMASDPKEVDICCYKGCTNSTVITLRSINGFEGRVFFVIKKSVSIMSSLRVELSSLDVYLEADGEAYCTLTLSVNPKIIPEEYYVDIIASGEGIEKSLRIQINAFG